MGAILVQTIVLCGAALVGAFIGSFAAIYWIQRQDSEIGITVHHQGTSKVVPRSDELIWEQENKQRGNA